MSIVFCFQTLAQTNVEYKNIYRIVKVNPATSVEINNKYGQVKISTWNKDSVSIHISIGSTKNISNKLQKVLESIRFDIKQTAYYVTVQTLIGSNRSSFISDLKNFLSGDNNIAIDYKLIVPSYLDLKITNKYGNVYIDNFKGKLNLNLSNGQLDAKVLGGSNKLNLSFCRATIQSIDNADIEIAFDSKLSVKRAGHLTFNSNSAVIDIEDISIIRINSRRDDYKINRVEYLYGKTYFSNISTKTIQKEVSIETTYGETILSLGKSVVFTNLTSKFTNITINTPLSATFKLNAEHINSEFSFPDSFSNIHQNLIKEGGTRTHTYGTIGTSNPSSEIRITATDSRITFNTK